MHTYLPNLLPTLVKHETPPYIPQPILSLIMNAACYPSSSLPLPKPQFPKEWAHFTQPTPRKKPTTL